MEDLALAASIYAARACKRQRNGTDVIPGPVRIQILDFLYMDITSPNEIVFFGGLRKWMCAQLDKLKSLGDFQLVALPNDAPIPPVDERFPIAQYNDSNNIRFVGFNDTLKFRAFDEILS